MFDCLTSSRPYAIMINLVAHMDDDMIIIQDTQLFKVHCKHDPDPTRTVYQCMLACVLKWMMWHPGGYETRIVNVPIQPLNKSVDSYSHQVRESMSAPSQ
ncbi:hypothetical protein ABKN59_010471 [Abortiporus biennis]